MKSSGCDQQGGPSDAVQAASDQRLSGRTCRAGYPPRRAAVQHHAAARLGDLNLRELWAYRELLYFLTWRDIKVRYKQTVLGVAWAIMQPVVSMLIFTLFFGKLANMPSDGIPYPIFAYAGLLPWTFVSNAVYRCRRQPGGQRRPGDQGLLSPPGDSLRRRMRGAGRFRDCLGDPLRDDDLVRRGSSLADADARAVGGDGGIAGGGRGDVDVGAQRQISRRALCACRS